MLLFVGLMNKVMLFCLQQCTKLEQGVGAIKDLRHPIGPTLVQSCALFYLGCALGSHAIKWKICQ